MTKILISACLLGQKVRYDGKDCLQNHTRLQKWLKQGKIIFICPEMAGGLGTPRLPAEIEPGKQAPDVLNNKAKVLDNQGNDVTDEFVLGANKALKLAIDNQVKIAILKARSPSCGSNQIYDGTFAKKLVEGSGVTATLLIQNGIEVFDETMIDEALDRAEYLIAHG